MQGLEIGLRPIAADMKTFMLMGVHIGHAPVEANLVVADPSR